MPNCLAKCTAGVISTSAVWVDGGAGCPVLIDKTVSLDASCNESVAYTQGGLPWAGSTIPVSAPTKVIICGGTIGPPGPSADNETITLCNALGEPILVQYNVLVVPPVELSRFNLATGLVEPAGPLTQCATGTAPITFTDRLVCATMADATVWELIERTSSLGAVTYLDPDTSPMTAPPVAFASILHSGACNCSDV